MPSRRFIPIPPTDEIAKLLREALAAFGQEATSAELHTVLSLLTTPEGMRFRQYQPEAIAELLENLADRGEIRRGPGNTYLTGTLEPEKIKEIFRNPDYANLASAIAQTRPLAVNQPPQVRDACLKRDFRNAFYAQDATLLASSIRVLQNLYSNDFLNTGWFDFLQDETAQWLQELPPSFLGAACWQHLPAAMLTLHPAHALAELLYQRYAELSSQALCALIDYAILCGDWKIVPQLIQRLPQGSAPRHTRVACLRFLTGRDTEAESLFVGALDSLRRETDSHHAYFHSIGGIFLVLSQLRINTPASLAAAAANALQGHSSNTPYSEIYAALELLARSRSMPEVTIEAPGWRPQGTCFLNDFFNCILQYWMIGDLGAEQREILQKLAERAAAGSYRWVAEECQELLDRLPHHTPTMPGRCHPGSKLPFLLDCIPNERSWNERLARLTRNLADLPVRGVHRLAWQINFDAAPRGRISVRPIEQHAGKSGNWSRGRRFTGYQQLDFEKLGSPVEAALFGIDMTPQDKFACDTLRNLEEAFRTSPPDDLTLQNASAQLLLALAGHPHLLLENADNRAVTCTAATPRIHVSRNLAALKYTLQPFPAANQTLVPRLENGDVIAVYEYTPALLKMAELLKDDFQIPAEAPENTALLNRLLQHFTVISETPLPLPNLTALVTNTIPVLRLIPQDRGLRVELLMSPFPTNNDFYHPGEGPIEMICRRNGRLSRFVRDPEAERLGAENLIADCPRLAASAPESPWNWFFEGAACYELSLQLHSLLDRCRVQWPEEHRHLCRKTLSLGNISLRTQSYQSWFAVEGEARLDDSEATISLGELIQAAGDKKRFVELSDGQVVALSDSLRKRLEELGRTGELGKNDDGGLRLQVCRFLVPFVAKELDGFAFDANALEYTQWIQQFDQAMKIEPPTPEGLKANLRPYQREGFLWLSRLDRAHAGACLADDMGLGKTLQAISLLLAVANEGPSLVVAPTSVCANWLTELKRFAPALKCSVFGAGNRAQTFKKLGPGQVLITSYGLLQSENLGFRKVNWRVAVLDEAQAIKNSHAKRSRAALEIHADFRIVTTGTPVENNLSELWSIFNFILPGLLGSRDNFQRRFAAPIEHDDDKDASQHLRNIVSPFLLRRRKDQVLSELPPKEDIDYPIELSAEERDFYNRLRLSILNDLENHQENDGQRHIRVLAGITKLRLAVDHPSLVDGGAHLPGSKLEAFMTLLKQVLDNGHKVLVFSQFVKFLSIVASTLESEGIPYEYLDGGQSPRERTTAVQNFQEGSVPVFLISLKAGGLGLNLTQADYVIHLDSWWNPAVENQASDRAHRLGQDKKVTIYHLQTAHTIEDKIKALHQRKRDLADQLLSDSDTINTKSLEELLKLLREE